MRRKLFTLASVISVLLLAAALTAWGRSYSDPDDSWLFTAQAGGWQPSSSAGFIEFGRVGPPQPVADLLMPFEPQKHNDPRLIGEIVKLPTERTVWRWWGFEE